MASSRRRQVEWQLTAILLLAASSAFADEGGVSFWLPGNYSSLAAVPADPGWSLPLVYYHSTGDESASKSFVRGGRITAGVDARADFFFVFPTYTFARSVAGGQAAVSAGAAYGPVGVEIDATLAAPNGATVAGSENDSRSGVSDLYPTATLKWNHGVHNTMTYVAAGVPTGTYDKNRLANTGTNHWAFDGGGGYTYLDPKSGHEVSAVVGLTYNLENSATQYRNGASLHIDGAASQFFSETFHAGLVGYYYDQLTGDSGAGATLGDFKARVAGLGPQAGWFLENESYLNLKGYWEFAARNRPEGWNVWLTLVVPLSEAKP